MARSKIHTFESDPISDSGGILLSLVQGEQFEYPINLSFIENSTDYDYEAVVIEARNKRKQKSPPSDIQEDGKVTPLNVFVPFFKGTWDAANSYSVDDTVEYEGSHYRRISGQNVVDPIAPLYSVDWETTSLKTIYIRFSEQLSTDWQVQPSVTGNTYGFFEIAVKERHADFPRTWKPIRGMIEIVYSPLAATEV